MGRKAKLTPLQLEVVREIVGSGDASFAELATIYGCCAETLRYQLRGLRPSVRLGQHNIDQIIQLRSAGKRVDDIAERTEVSENSIYRILRKYHVLAPDNALRGYCDAFKNEVRAACLTERVRTVADRYRVPENTVYSWLRGHPRTRVRARLTNWNFGAAR